MIKLALVLSYDGSRFLGSQSQPHKRSVEDELKLALAKIGVFEPVIMSSRTDKGVHSLGQVASVRVNKSWQGRQEHFKKELNRHLSPFVRVGKIWQCEMDFHARFSAKARSYRYFISLKPPNAFNAAYFSHYPNLGGLNIKKANALLVLFKGRHDFSSFSKAGGGVKSYVREIYAARCYFWQGCLVINFKANGFLRSQVRLMVAAFLKALSLDENEAQNAIKAQLENKKNLTRLPASPQGLYLVRVHYF